MPNLNEDRRTAQRDLLQSFVKRQMEAGKWLLGSLLIINGGALAALLSNASLGSHLLEISAYWFIGGVVSAFFAGAFSWSLSNAYFYSLRQILGVKLYQEEDLKKLKGINSMADVSTVIMLVSSVVSLACFGVGAAVAANGLNVGQTKAVAPQIIKNHTGVH